MRVGLSIHSDRRLPVRSGWSVREAGDGPLARFVTRRNRWRWSPLREALRELARNP